MKSNKLPLYLLFVLVGVSLIWRVVNPPAPLLPGPINAFPGWKSVRTIGQMSSQTVNPSGTMWAGAWNETLPSGEPRSAVRIIDFNGYLTTSCRLPDGVKVDYLSWAGDNTIRAFCIDSNSDAHVAYIDASTGNKKSEVDLKTRVVRVLSWPAASDKLTVVTDENDKSAKMAVLSESSKMAVGKEIAVEIPKGGSLSSDAGVAADGSSFVFSITDPAAKAGRSYYLADTATGTAKKAFDLGDVPGRIEGIWPSAAGIMMVCNVKEKLVDVVYDPTAGKLAVQPDGVGDVGKWPGAPKVIAFTTYDGGFEFDLAKGKTKAAFDLTKKTTESDKYWRDLVRDSRFYRIKSGNVVTVSESSGAIDIRELKPDGTWFRNMLPRT